jgi:hypothetical protein
MALAMTGQIRPSADHVAMHRCDNPICVNPAHLSWGTVAENNEDRVWKARARRAAERSYTAQLTAQDTRRRTVTKRSHNAKLTAEDVRYIRSSPSTTLALAQELGVTNQCISRIRLRQTWRHID